MYSDRGIDFIDCFICGFPVPLWNLVKERRRKLRDGTSADSHASVSTSPFISRLSHVKYKTQHPFSLPLIPAHWITTDTQTKPTGPRALRHTQTNTDQVTPPPHPLGGSRAALERCLPGGLIFYSLCPSVA